jgi:hypothetical protein
VRRTHFIHFIHPPVVTAYHRIGEFATGTTCCKFAESSKNHTNICIMSPTATTFSPSIKRNRAAECTYSNTRSGDRNPTTQIHSIELT